MTEDLLNKFKKQHELLGKLYPLIPEGEGDVHLMWYSDGSGRIGLEMWGCLIAHTYSYDGLLYVDNREARCYDKAAREELEQIVSRMNDVIKLEES